MEGIFDATIAVIAEEERQGAASGRHGAIKRSRSARPDSSHSRKRRTRATYVIVNDGTVEQLEAKLSGVLEKLSAAK